MNSLWTVRAEFVFKVNVWLRCAFTLGIAWTKNVRSTALQNYPIVTAWWLICWVCLIIVWEKESICRLKAVRDLKLTLTIPDQLYKYFKGKLVIDRWSNCGLSWAVRCHLELICLWLIILVWQPDFLLFDAFFFRKICSEAEKGISGQTGWCGNTGRGSSIQHTHSPHVFWGGESKGTVWQRSRQKLPSGKEACFSSR